MQEFPIEANSFKLNVFKSFPFKRLTEVTDAICALGFEATLVDNGNVVFVEKNYIKEKSAE